MSGTVTGIAITTSATAVVRAYLIISFVITKQTVTMEAMRVTVVMLHVSWKEILPLLT